MAARGGKRVAGDGKKLGRPKNEPQSAELPKPRKQLATEIRASLGGQFRDHKDDCCCEACLWKHDAEQPGALGRPARSELWNRDEGKPVHIVNHLHDKPIEHTVTISIAETIQKARKRAGK